MSSEILRYNLKRSVNKHLWLSYLVVFGLLGGVFTWATLTEISGAVISSGTVVIKGSNKTLQHPDGGVISEIRVSNGDLVEVGDLLVRLDAAVIEANLELARHRYFELLAERARIHAELRGDDQITFPIELTEQPDSFTVQSIMANHQTLLDSRYATRERAIKQLRVQVAQLNSSIAGLRQQAKARRREQAVITERLQSTKFLFEKELTAITNLQAIRREQYRMEGLLGATYSELARVQHQLGERNLQIAGIELEARVEMIERLREMRVEIVQTRLDKLHHERILSRVDIRAPNRGIVHNVSVHTIGGVVQPAEPILEILPADDELVLELEVRPVDIEQIYPGQPVSAQFPGLNARTVPRLKAELVYVSGDLVTDAQDGRQYYMALAHLLPEAFAQLNGVELIPGMPALAFIETRKRTVLTYLVDPLKRQIDLALKED